MLPLFAATVNLGLLILIGILGFIGTYALVTFFFRKDDEGEQLDKDAAEAYAFFKNLGWTHVAEFLSCTLSEDRTGQWNVLQKMRALIGDPAALRDHLKRVTLKQIKFLMDDDMSFIEQIKEIVQNTEYVEKAQRQAEKDLERARELREEEKLLDKIRLRQLEAAAAGKPADPAAAPVAVPKV